MKTYSFFDWVSNTGCTCILREELEAFSLYQVEDDGEVDYDMPALDNKKPIYQFGFKSLAIVEKDIPKRSETVKMCVMNEVIFHKNSYITWDQKCDSSTSICSKISGEEVHA